MLVNDNKLAKLLILVAVIFTLVYSIKIELSKTIWLDEFDSTLQINVNTISQLITNYYNGSDTHPPFYFICLFLIKQIFGNSLLTFRILSVVFTLAGLLFMILILIELGFKKSIYYALLIAVSSAFLVNFLISEIRPYALYFLLTYCLFYFRTKYYKKNNLNWGIGYTIIVILFLYTHYYSILYFTLLVLAELFFILTKKNNWLSFLPYLFSLLLFSIWIPAIFHQFSAFNNIVHHLPPDFYTLMAVPFKFFRYLFIPVVLFICIFSLYILNGRIKIDHHNLVILIIFIIAPCLIFLTSYVSNPAFSERYFVPCFCGLLIISAIGLQELIDRINKKIILFIFIFLMFLYSYQRLVKVDRVYSNQKATFTKNLFLSHNSIIVCESPLVFAPLYYYSNKKNVFLINSYKSDREGENINQCYFDHLWFKKKKQMGMLINIYEWEEFKSQFDEFFLINEKSRKLFEKEISIDNNYCSQLLRDSVYYVQNKVKTK